MTTKMAAQVFVHKQPLHDLHKLSYSLVGATGLILKLMQVYMPAHYQKVAWSSTNSDYCLKPVMTLSSQGIVEYSTPSHDHSTNSACPVSFGNVTTQFVRPTKSYSSQNTLSQLSLRKVSHKSMCANTRLHIMTATSRWEEKYQPVMMHEANAFAASLDANNTLYHYSNMYYHHSLRSSQCAAWLNKVPVSRNLLSSKNTDSSDFSNAERPYNSGIQIPCGGHQCLVKCKIFMLRGEFSDILRLSFPKTSPLDLTAEACFLSSPHSHEQKDAQKDAQKDGNGQSQGNGSHDSSSPGGGGRGGDENSNPPSNSGSGGKDDDNGDNKKKMPDGEKEDDNQEDEKTKVEDDKKRGIKSEDSDQKKGKKEVTKDDGDKEHSTKKKSSNQEKEKWKVTDDEGDTPSASMKDQQRSKEEASDQKYSVYLLVSGGLSQDVHHQDEVERRLGYHSVDIQDEDQDPQSLKHIKKAQPVIKEEQTTVHAQNSRPKSMALKPTSPSPLCHNDTTNLHSTNVEGLSLSINGQPSPCPLVNGDIGRELKSTNEKTISKHDTDEGLGSQSLTAPLPSPPLTEREELLKLSNPSEEQERDSSGTHAGNVVKSEEPASAHPQTTKESTGASCCLANHTQEGKEMAPVAFQKQESMKFPSLSLVDGSISEQQQPCSSRDDENRIIQHFSSTSQNESRHKPYAASPSPSSDVSSFSHDSKTPAQKEKHITEKSPLPDERHSEVVGPQKENLVLGDAPTELVSAPQCHSTGQPLGDSSPATVADSEIPVDDPKATLPIEKNITRTSPIQQMQDEHSEVVKTLEENQGATQGAVATGCIHSSSQTLGIKQQKDNRSPIIPSRKELADDPVPAKTQTTEYSHVPKEDNQGEHPGRSRRAPVPQECQHDRHTGNTPSPHNRTKSHAAPTGNQLLGNLSSETVAAEPHYQSHGKPQHLSDNNPILLTNGDQRVGDLQTSAPKEKEHVTEDHITGGTTTAAVNEPLQQPSPSHSLREHEDNHSSRIPFAPPNSEESADNTSPKEKRHDTAFSPVLEEYSQNGQTHESQRDSNTDKKPAQHSRTRKSQEMVTRNEAAEDTTTDVAAAEPPSQGDGKGQHPDDHALRTSQDSGDVKRHITEQSPIVEESEGTCIEVKAKTVGQLGSYAVSQSQDKGENHTDVVMTIDNTPTVCQLSPSTTPENIQHGLPVPERTFRSCCGNGAEEDQVDGAQCTMDDSPNDLHGSVVPVQSEDTAHNTSEGATASVLSQVNSVSGCRLVSHIPHDNSCEPVTTIAIEEAPVMTRLRRDLLQNGIRPVYGCNLHGFPLIAYLKQCVRQGLDSLTANTLLLLVRCFTICRSWSKPFSLDCGAVAVNVETCELEINAARCIESSTDHAEVFIGKLGVLVRQLLCEITMLSQDTNSETGSYECYSQGINTDSTKNLLHCVLAILNCFYHGRDVDVIMKYLVTELTHHNYK